MKLAILQHTKDEPAGLFESYARQAGVPCEITPLYTTTEVPPLNATHLLILGGPMSVNQEGLFPYLVDEKRLIRSFVAAGRPVLGVCLGAQLIASACGGKVFPCREEIGWNRVESAGSVHSPVFRPHSTHSSSMARHSPIPLEERGYALGMRLKTRPLSWEVPSASNSMSR